jgi:hypothetical protein
LLSLLLKKELRLTRLDQLPEAIDLVPPKQFEGRWLVETPCPGKVPLATDEAEGRLSRLNTLRALRDLAWYPLPGRGFI